MAEKQVAAMSRKRALQEEVVLTGEESDAINQINKEYSSRNPKLIRNVSLTPFQLSFCDETKASSFVKQFQSAVIHVSSISFDTTPDARNRFQLLVFAIGGNNMAIAMPILFFLCGSSSEEIVSACSLAIKRIKAWIGNSESISHIFGPPELKNEFQQHFPKLPFNLSFADVLENDTKWMQQNFPEHTSQLQTSLNLLFHNKDRNLDDFLQQWSQTCCPYAEEFKRTWNPSVNTIERSHFEIDSIASTFINQIYKKHGNPIVNTTFPSLIATLHANTEHWYFYWETFQQITTSMDGKMAAANFKAQVAQQKVQEALPELAPFTPPHQHNPSEGTMDDSQSEEGGPSPAKIPRISCQSCYQKKHNNCSNGCCKNCCKKFRCKEPSHMEAPKLRLLLAKEIRDINDAIRLKKPLQITYQHEKNVVVVHEVAWKKQAEAFSGRTHTDVNVFKLMHVLNSKVIRTKQEQN